MTHLKAHHKTSAAFVFTQIQISGDILPARKCNYKHILLSLMSYLSNLNVVGVLQVKLSDPG